MFQNKLKEHTLKEKARDSCLAFSFSMKRAMKREIRKFTLWSCEGLYQKLCQDVDCDLTTEYFCLSRILKL